jgi:hypothetical protein
LRRTNRFDGVVTGDQSAIPVKIRNEAIVAGNICLLRRTTCAVTEDVHPQQLLTIPDETVVTVVKGVITMVTKC